MRHTPDGCYILLVILALEYLMALIVVDELMRFVERR